MSSVSLLCVCALLATAACIAEAANTPIPRVNATGDAVVAGLSAGAFFASQFHVAYSSHLVGAAVFAGGPYYCAQDSITYALVDCTNFPSGINVDTLVGAAKSCAQQGLCDSTDNLAHSKVYVYAGSKDTVVNPGSGKAAVQFYSNFMDAARITSVFDVPAQHAWPTSNYGNACDTLGSPYINNCGYNGSYEALSVIYGALNAPTSASADNLHTISTSSFLPSGVSSPASISLGDQAYVYIPQTCVQQAGCRVVIALHGCQQTTGDIGTVFVEHISLNEIAEANRLVVLYPQAVKSQFSPSNPEGCFDWWGYTASNYATNAGVQMATVFNMFQSLRQ